MLIGEFDSVLGMGALSDKDSGDRHMSRLICMPPMLRRQITSYFAHCASISRQFIGYLPQDEEDHQWSRGFFLQIGQAGVRRAEITQGNIYDQMGLVSGYTTHRVNAHRKFIRTELT
ncbi:hypothetical protein JTL87_34540, partial [Pseudomonas aeruginosa]|nr:hypothetical protein [Pseudomonas aeruginosa]